MIAEKRREQGIQEPVDAHTPFKRRQDKMLAKLAEPESPEAIARREKREREEAERDRRRETAERQNRWKQFIENGPGRRYETCTLEDFQISCTSQADAIAALKNYEANLASHIAECNGVLLHGVCGSGKDHALVALARTAILSNVATVEWRDGVSLFLELRSAIGGVGSEQAIINKLSSVDVLVLSDPAPPSGVPTDYQLAVLFRILNRRYGRRLSTWTSINCADRVAVEGRLGVPICERLFDDALVVRFNWPSYRKPMGQTHRA